jgi:hypothetical protein
MLDHFLVLAVCAMRKIQPENIDTRLVQFHQFIVRIAGRANGGDELGFSFTIH